MGDEQKQIYHEKQKLQFCLLHSLNNLFQEKDAFTRKDLDDIAEKLVQEDPYEGNRMPFSVIFKPHHNSLTGKLMGIVLNVPVRKYGGLWRSRHWVSLRRINGIWYNLDSDFTSPCSFGSTEELRDFLDAAIDGGTELLLVKDDD
ncbi:unnamed protein product [Lactuca virosa]|uniref:ubiquitinyl hydrolase 1 n=1 Tax=Lactuca virosa TaxID=75947 RepID=A0AAU9LY34_9ASTR|nr:unnamed protein product [Lactuca virosa]